MYKHNPGNASWDEGSADETGGGDWGQADSAEAGAGEQSWESFATPELTAVHSSLMEAMASLKDPRTR
ncbi:hypothetical protein [Nocardia fluminea]|uniref:hypothetical protein n=1 Tax=Nocardia fluminea TaxID=134984 RepID=UPI0037A9C950